MKYFALFILFIPNIILGQDSPESVLKKLGHNPLLIVDSIKIQNGSLLDYDVYTIASISILIDTTAQKTYGAEAKSGAIIVETNAFARKNYISFFRHISSEYDSIYTLHESDSAFQYFLNDNILKEHYFGYLSAVNDDTFISLEILNDKQLQEKYSIHDKQFGILIKSKRPSHLVGDDKKY
jgi:hypothetical protein